jgi:hypothetical protein
MSPPTITLSGDAVTIDCGDTFAEPGATAIDDRDGQVDVQSDAEAVVDSAVPAEFTVTYTATDAAGNEATAMRTVYVCGDGCGEVGVETIDFASWEIEQYEQFFQEDANWTLGDPTTSAVQGVNADASILLSSFDTTDLEIQGTWVTSGGGDDDLMGFVFGYQDRGRFYLFDWKGASQSHPSGVGLAPVGMTVKVVEFVEDVEPQDPPAAMVQLRNADIWPVGGSVNVRPLERPVPLSAEDDPGCVGDPLPFRCTLWHNDVPWRAGVKYRWTLEYRSDVFRIEVRGEDDSVLESWVIEDDTYTSGRFGLYNFSQGGVTYEAFTRELIPPTCSTIVE